MEPVDVGLYCSVRGTYIHLFYSHNIRYNQQYLFLSYLNLYNTVYNINKWMKLTSMDKDPEGWKANLKNYTSDDGKKNTKINPDSILFNFEQQARSRESDWGYWDFVWRWRSSRRDKQRRTPTLSWISSSRYISRCSLWCSLPLSRSQYHCLPLFLPLSQYQPG